MLCLINVILFLTLFLILFLLTRSKRRPVSDHKFNYYIINLDRNPERLNNFLHSFYVSDLYDQKLNRFQAYDGKLLKLENHIKDSRILDGIYNTEINKYRLKHNQLTRGAVGCYLSHLELIKYTSQSNLPSLIFEDDAIMYPHIGKKIEQLLKTVPDNWDVLLVGYICHQCQGLADYVKVKNFWGNHGYIVNKKGAKKLLQYAYPITIQIDHLMSSLAKKGILNIYASREQLVRQNNLFNSDIQTPILPTNIDPFSD